MSTQKKDIMKTGFILIWGTLILLLVICTRCYGLSDNSLGHKSNIAPSTKAECAVTKSPQDVTEESSTAYTFEEVTYVTGSAESNESCDISRKDEELLWLSAIIHAEARGECFKGKLAVGTVVMNRTESEEFPDTVKEVIFDRRYGTQFSPVDDGSIYLTPSEESVLAAKMCLDGYRTDPDILFFYNPSISESTYFRENRTYAFTVGSHEFFS